MSKQAAALVVGAVARDPSKRPLTADEIHRAERLRAVWESENQRRRAAGLPSLRQKDAAEVMGVTQGAVSHWLCGRTPIGVVAALRLASVLNCRVQDFWPDFGFGAVVPGELSNDAVEIAARYDALPPSQREAVASVIRALLQRT